MKQSNRNARITEDGVRFFAKSTNGKTISELIISTPQGDSIFGILYDKCSDQDWERIPKIILDHAKMDGWWESDSSTEISKYDLEIFLKLLKELSDNGCISGVSSVENDKLLLCVNEVYGFLIENHSLNIKLCIQSI